MSCVWVSCWSDASIVDVHDECGGFELESELLQASCTSIRQLRPSPSWFARYVQVQVYVVLAVK